MIEDRQAADVVIKHALCRFDHGRIYGNRKHRSVHDFSGSDFAEQVAEFIHAQRCGIRELGAAHIAQCYDADQPVVIEHRNVPNPVLTPPARCREEEYEG